MDNHPGLSDELAATLRRYLAIQSEEQRLREEKAALQDKLASHMAGHRLASWYPELDNQPLKVRFTETTVVDYDEALLKARLGPRFTAVLAPDLKKIRRSLLQIGEVLAPVMDLVGSPSADRVRAAIEQGLVRKEEFAGAFRKTTRRLVAVSKFKSDEPPEEGSG